MAAFSELLSRAKKAASNGKSLLNIGRQQYVQALEDTAAYYARKAGVPDGYTSTIPTPTPIPTPAVRTERKASGASNDTLAAREAAQRLSYSLPAEAQASVGRQRSSMTGTELREAAANQEQIKKDLNTVDLYVNRGLTGTERLEKQEDLIRAAQNAAAEEEQRRTAGLTGTERLAPVREAEQQKKALESEKDDMYSDPGKYIWTEPLTGTERREKGYDYTNRFDYGTELAKRGAEYDSQIEKIDQQIAELRAINYGKLAYEPDFNKYVKIGAEMESELRDNPDEGTHLGNVSAEIYEGSYTGFDLLTKEEQKIYNYLLGKYGKESAEQYYEFMRTTVNHRYGQRVARAIQNSAWKTGVLIANSLGTGVTNWMAGALGAYGAVTGQKLPENSLNYASQYIKEDLGKAGQIAYDLGVTVGNMLPSVLVGGPAGIVMQSVSAGGNAYQQGLREGMTEGQAWAYGLAVGASEACLQRVMGGISRLGGVTDDVIKAASGVENGILKFALKTGWSAVKEGSEEALQAVLEPIFKSIFTWDKLNIDWSEVTYNALMGALTGGLLGGDTKARAMYSNTRLVEEDIAEYVATGERQHIRNGKEAQLRMGESPILTTTESIAKFIRDSLAGRRRNIIKAYGRVGWRFSTDVYVKSGGSIDIAGYYMELDANKLAHMKDHLETDKDLRNIPLTEEQLMRLPEYIDNYDDIIEVIRRKDGSVRIMLGKKINGHTIIIETVSKGRKSVHPVTAYKIPTEWYNSFYKPKAVTPNTSQTASAAERGYKAITASVSNLPQAKNKVNGRTTGGEYPRIYTEYLQNRGQSPTEGMPYAEHLLKQAEKKGNIYAKALIKAEIEKAQRSSRSANADASTPMPTIYADYIKAREQVSGEENDYRVIESSVKGLLRAGRVEANGRFLNRNEKLYQYAEKINTIEGYEDFTCHADEKMFYIDCKGNGSEDDFVTLSPEEYADAIKNSNSYKGGNIRIISCQAGALEDGAAQRLADALNIMVYAPTETVNVDEDGNMFVTDNDILAELWYSADRNERTKFKETGQWKLFIPRKGD